MKPPKKKKSQKVTFKDLSAEQKVKLGKMLQRLQNYKEQNNNLRNKLQQLTYLHNTQKESFHNIINNLSKNQDQLKQYIQQKDLLINQLTFKLNSLQQKTYLHQATQFQYPQLQQKGLQVQIRNQNKNQPSQTDILRQNQNQKIKINKKQKQKPTKNHVSSQYIGSQINKLKQRISEIYQKQKQKQQKQIKYLHYSQKRGKSFTLLQKRPCVYPNNMINF